MKLYAIAVFCFALLTTFGILLRANHLRTVRAERRRRIQQAIDTSPAWQGFAFDLGELGRDIANLHMHVDAQIMEAMDVLTPVPTRDWEEL